MHVLKSIAHSFLLTFLSMTLVVGLPLMAIVSRVSEPKTVTGWFSEANFYENLTANLSDIISFEGEEGEASPERKSLGEQLDELDGISREDFTSALQDGLPPEYLQSQIEPVIESFVNWAFNGAELEFEISLADRKDELRQSLAGFFRSYIDSLPECSVSQVQNFDGDVLEAQCRPPADSGINIDSEINNVTRTLVNEAEIFNESFTQDDFNEDEAELQETQQNFANIKAAANSVPLLVVVVATLAALCGRNIFRGLRNVGIMLAIMGLLVGLVWSVVGNYDVSSLDLSLSDGEEGPQAEALQNVMVPLIETAVSDISSSVASYALWTAILGVLMVGGYYLYMHRIHHRDHVRTDTKQENQDSKTKNQKPKTE